MDDLRALRERRHSVIINDPQPVASTDEIWNRASQFAVIGIFIFLLLAALYVARPVLLPIVAAMIIAMTFAPIMKRADRGGLSAWVTASLISMGLFAVALVGIVLLSGPLIEWIGRGPEIATIIKQKLYVLDWPLAALRDLQTTLMPPAANTVKIETDQISLLAPVVAVVTPAVAQMVIFAATLFFALAAQVDLRKHMTSFFTDREAKLRLLKIANDIENNLAAYAATVTAINLALGVTVAIGAWLFGFPNPITLGLLTMILNYIPYIGPACMMAILLVVGLVTFPTLTYALIPPAVFAAVITVEGQIITPTVLGHQLTLNPLLVFTAIVFWAWLWGPIGAFLAVPLSIVMLVVFNHVFPSDDGKLPG